MERKTKIEMDRIENYTNIAWLTPGIPKGEVGAEPY